jgi:hypothetical protein
MMALDPAAIERLRENSRIRLDREGRFWHEESLVEHPRVAEAFHRGLGRAPDGRATLKVGNTWCYIQVEDSLYLVRRALCESSEGDVLAACVLRLDDGSEEALEPATLAVNGEGVLYARVKEGREWARFIPEAQLALGRYIDGDDDGALRVRTARGAFVVGEKS